MIEERKPKQYDLAVIIGRFQLPHAGHTLLFRKAASMAKHVLILKGSSYQPRTIKNPFTYDEINRMLQDQFKYELPETTLFVHPIRDNIYSDDSWLCQVQSAINRYSKLALMRRPWGDTDAGTHSAVKVCIIGHKKEKDPSTYYLDLFPQYDFINIEEFKLRLDSTSLRNLLFNDPKQLLEVGKHLVSIPTYDFLNQFTCSATGSKYSEIYDRLIREYKIITDYKKSWESSPYPPVFVTVDALVIKAGHIALIQRKEAPGEDLWALPGGFVNSGERIFPAALRELGEETNLDLPPGLIKGSFEKSHIFDHPDRSLRGRTITHAHLFKLDDHDKKPGLPKLRAADDAKDAKWFTLDEVTKMSEVMFEDHLSIITNVLGLEQ